MEKKIFAFVGKQVTRLAVAILCGLVSGRVLAMASTSVVNLVDPALLAAYDTAFRIFFWLVPALISFLVAMLLQLAVRPLRREG
jgi:hypothetical protein